MLFGAFCFFLPENELLKMYVKLNSKPLGFSGVQSSSRKGITTGITLVVETVVIL